MKFFILLVCTVNQYVTLDCVAASNEDVYAAGHFARNVWRLSNTAQEYHGFSWSLSLGA